MRTDFQSRWFAIPHVPTLEHRGRSSAPARNQAAGRDDVKHGSVLIQVCCCGDDRERRSRDIFSGDFYGNDKGHAPGAVSGWPFKITNGCGIGQY